MLGTGSTHLNDNIRTEHLKCSSCRTQIFLVSIVQDDDGAELRIFGCPHCARTRSLRLGAAARDVGGALERAETSERA